MQRKSAFKWNEWNHEYLGWLLLILSPFFNWSLWLLIPGLILTIDGLTQLWLGQYSGVLHWLYSKTLYKIKLIRKLNNFLDRLFSGAHL